MVSEMVTSVRGRFIETIRVDLMLYGRLAGLSRLRFSPSLMYIASTTTVRMSRQRHDKHTLIILTEG